nr:hypothetical protein Q903MT_gene5927 [Picea sitchensis]
MRIVLFRSMGEPDSLSRPVMCSFLFYSFSRVYVEGDSAGMIEHGLISYGGNFHSIYYISLL